MAEEKQNKNGANDKELDESTSVEDILPEMGPFGQFIYMLFQLFRISLQAKMADSKYPMQPIFPFIGSAFIAYMGAMTIPEHILIPAREAFGKGPVLSVISITVIMIYFLLCTGAFLGGISKAWTKKYLLAEWAYISSPEYNPRKVFLVACVFFANMFVTLVFLLLILFHLR